MRLCSQKPDEKDYVSGALPVVLRADRFVLASAGSGSSGFSLYVHFRFSFGLVYEYTR